MTIAELGALGEFLGFFAVLATLIYLAVQTHQSNRVAISQATRSVFSDFEAIWATLREDPERTRIVRVAVNDWDALSKNDQMIAHNFFCSLIAHFNNALEQRDKLPEMDDFIHAWEDNILGLVQCSGGKKWYDKCTYLFHPTGINRISKRLSNPDSLPPAWTDTMSWWCVDSAELESRKD